MPTLVASCQTVGAKVEVPKFGDAGSPPLMTERDWPPRNTPVARCVVMPNLVVLVETVYRTMSVHTYIHRRPAFQGHLRSLEPTRIDWLSMTSY